jgi:2-phospho-L-lactate guanylyltransferase (CobY/MobA/RfbA family)
VSVAPGAWNMDIDTIELEDRGTELLALARLVAFALESAKSLDAEVVEFCLDKALRAVLDQIDEPSRMMLTSSDIMLMNRSALC